MRTSRFFLLILFIVTFSSCSVYQNVTGFFNTYYNVKKLYGEAVDEIQKNRATDQDTNYFAAYKINQTIDDKFEKVILVHGVREVKELAYHDYLTQELPQHELLGEMVREQFLYYPTVTRESYVHQGRITDLLESGRLTADLGLPQLNRAHDRVMICGSPQMLRDLKKMLDDRGFAEEIGRAHV